MEQAQLLTLIEKCRQGDQAAQEKLVVEAQDKVYYHCKKFLKNNADAQDATQDVLITMLTSLEKLREPARRPRFIKTVWGVGYTIEK